MSRSRRSSVDLSAGVIPPRSRRSSVDFSAGVGQISRRPSVDYSSGVGPLGLPIRLSVDSGFSASVVTNNRRPSVDLSPGVEDSLSRWSSYWSPPRTPFDNSSLNLFSFSVTCFPPTINSRPTKQYLVEVILKRPNYAVGIICKTVRYQWNLQ